MRLLLSLLLLVSVSSLSRAQSTSELLDQLKAELREQIKAEPDNDRERPTSAEVVLASVARIDATALEEGDSSEEVLVSIGSMTKSEKAQEIITRLISALRKKKKENEAAYSAKVDLMVQETKTSLAAAKKASDLDPIITNLGDFLNSAQNAYSSRLSTESQRVQSALEIARRWQDYLFKKEKGDSRAANEILGSLANNRAADAFVPRSKILALAAENDSDDSIDSADRAMDAAQKKRSAINEKIQPILDKLKTLQDLDATVSALRKLQADNFNLDVPALRSLSELQRNYIEFQNGLTTTVDFGMSYNNNDLPPEAIPLRARLVTLVLPRYLGVSEEAGDEESPYDYLTRIAGDSKSKNDWVTYARAIDALRVLSARGNGAGLGNLSGLDYTALTSFLSAINQEKAGQYAAALTSYRSALRSTGATIPAEYIGQRITAIEKEHPEAIQEFKQQQQEAAALQNRYPPGFMPPGMQRPTPPQMPEPTDKLRVPPASKSGKPKE